LPLRCGTTAVAFGGYPCGPFLESQRSRPIAGTLAGAVASRRSLTALTVPIASRGIAARSRDRSARVQTRHVTVSPLEAATTRRGVKDVLPGRAVLEPAVGLNAAPDHKGRIVVEVRHSAVPYHAVLTGIPWSKSQFCPCRMCKATIGGWARIPAHLRESPLEGRSRPPRRRQVS
jgi:hypothetical protein